ncbi:hypothetical protein [Actinokineospora xionganensis]|nr:hypothetical protein [Actinokineospora xionganensis]
MDLQAQRLEQLAGEFVRQCVEVAAADGQQVEQVGVRLVVAL